ncbi:Pore-forming peptide ameobapore C [Entamoeba marina]
MKLLLLLAILTFAIAEINEEEKEKENVDIVNEEIQKEQLDDSKQWTPLCITCEGFVEGLEHSLLDASTEKALNFLEGLCDKTSGFFETICSSIFDYGIDEFVVAILEKVAARALCTMIMLC